MATAIPGITSTPTTPATTTAPAALTSSDFMNLMIQQLSQQDPLNPTDSNQLLTQMAQISALQSNTTLQSSLTSLTLQQSIAAGGNLIGKAVTGLDANGNGLQGVVTSIKVANQQVNLELDNGGEMPMPNVTQISATGSSTLSSLASSVPQLQQLLSSAGANGTSGSSSTLSNLANVMTLLGGANGTSGSSTSISNIANLLSMLNGSGG